VRSPQFSFLLRCSRYTIGGLEKDKALSGVKIYLQGYGELKYPRALESS
jgi:hypothetical protein